MAKNYVEVDPSFKGIERTKWFKGRVKPVHVGLYERKSPSPETHRAVYAWWDGKQWRMNSCYPDRAVGMTGESLYQDDMLWRGCVEKQT